MITALPRACVRVTFSAFASAETPEDKRVFSLPAEALLPEVPVTG